MGDDDGRRQYIERKKRLVNENVEEIINDEFWRYCGFLFNKSEKTFCQKGLDYETKLKKTV